MEKLMLKKFGLSWPYFFLLAQRVHVLQLFGFSGRGRALIIWVTLNVGMHKNWLKNQVLVHVLIIDLPLLTSS